MSVTIREEESKSVGGCNSCSYPDGWGGTVFQININNQLIRLCPNCLEELKRGIESIDKRYNVKKKDEEGFIPTSEFKKRFLTPKY